jgi:hypothetical protein
VFASAIQTSTGDIETMRRANTEDGDPARHLRSITRKVRLSAKPGRETACPLFVRSRTTIITPSGHVHLQERSLQSTSRLVSSTIKVCGRMASPIVRIHLSSAMQPPNDVPPRPVRVIPRSLVSHHRPLIQARRIHSSNLLNHYWRVRGTKKPASSRPRLKR